MKRKKVKLLSRVQLFATPWTIAYQTPQSMEIFQARVLEWVAISFFPTQELNAGLLHHRQMLYHLSHQEALIYILVKTYWASLIVQLVKNLLAM